VALVLLIASGLLLRSFEKLRDVDPGFRTDHLLTANYRLPQTQYSRQVAIDTFNSTLLRRLERLPGIEAVGITSYLPASGMVRNSTFVADGYVPTEGTEVDIAWPSSVMGDYFRAAGIPLLSGRLFSGADNVKAPLVWAVSTTAGNSAVPTAPKTIARTRRISIGMRANLCKIATDQT